MDDFDSFFAKTQRKVTVVWWVTLGFAVTFGLLFVTAMIYGVRWLAKHV